jgi:hypothetical protein
VLYSGAPVLDLSDDDVTVKKRLPPFYRLDFRVEKRWTIGESGFVTLVLEMLNTFLAREALGESCNELGVCTPDRLGPIAIPSFGVEGGF